MSVGVLCGSDPHSPEVCSSVSTINQLSGVHLNQPPKTRDAWFLVHTGSLGLCSVLGHSYSALAAATTLAALVSLP